MQRWLNTPRRDDPYFAGYINQKSAMDVLTQVNDSLATLQGTSRGKKL